MQKHDLKACLKGFKVKDFVASIKGSKKAELATLEFKVLLCLLVLAMQFEDLLQKASVVSSQLCVT